MNGGRRQASNDDTGTNRHAGWEGALLDDVIKRFMDEIPVFVDRLQEALQARDMPFLRSTAYQIRGVTGLLQAHALSELARELEECARTEDIACVCRVANELVRELQNLMDVLEDLT